MIARVPTGVGYLREGLKVFNLFCHKITPSNESVMLELSIKRKACDGEADENSAKPPFAAECKIIVDKPAQVQADKNYGGDINPNA